MSARLHNSHHDAHPARPHITINQSASIGEDDSPRLRASCEAEFECENADSCPENHFEWSLNTPTTRRGRRSRYNKSSWLRVRQTARLVASAGKSRLKSRSTADFDTRRVSRVACSSLFGGSTVAAAIAEIETRDTADDDAIFVSSRPHLIGGVDSTSVKLAWRLPPLADPRQVDGFIVERRSFGDRVWRPHHDFRTSTLIVVAYVARHLRPSTSYQVRPQLP